MLAEINNLYQKFTFYFLKYNLKIIGPVMVISLWVILLAHVYAYIVIIVPMLIKKIGLWTVGWMGIGLILVYNILWNHVLASIVKPGSPVDLRKIETLRVYDSGNCDLQDYSAALK